MPCAFAIGLWKVVRVKSLKSKNFFGLRFPTLSLKVLIMIKLIKWIYLMSQTRDFNLFQTILKA